MATQKLSPREEEIVELCIDGLTNEAIAYRLGLSIGTVNTYWLRIKMKVGGLGRTDTVVKVLKERAERELRESSLEENEIANVGAEKENQVFEFRAALALLQLAMEQIKSTVWATDKNLNIHVIANGESPSTPSGVAWNVGKTVFDIFKTKDPMDSAVAAHLRALEGKESEVRLNGDFANMLLHVAPLSNEAGDRIGCVSVLNPVGV